MTEVRRGRKGKSDSSTLRLQGVLHNYDYVIHVAAMGGKLYPSGTALQSQHP